MPVCLFHVVWEVFQPAARGQLPAACAFFNSQVATLCLLPHAFRLIISLEGQPRQPATGHHATPAGLSGHFTARCQMLRHDAACLLPPACLFVTAGLAPCHVTLLCQGFSHVSCWSLFMSRHHAMPRLTTHITPRHYFSSLVRLGIEVPARPSLSQENIEAFCHHAIIH